MSNRDPRFAGPSIPSVTVREVRERLTAGEEPAPALIDVREAWEYAEGHAAGAVSLPLSELQARVSEVPRDRDVFLICHVGNRSLTAARFLKGQGVERSLNVEGGTDEWEAARLPMER
jgi:rhodanese-related sulfurtransferase